MQSAFEDRVWLVWLVRVRVLILTVLLGIELAIAQFTPVAFPIRLFVNVMLLAYTLSAFYLVLLHVWKELRAQSVLQIITDLLLVSLLVYITGGVDSSLNFLYPLVIVVAAILLPRTWAYLTSALAFLLYGTVLELCYFQIVPSYSVTHPGIRTLQGIIFVNLFGYLAIAYLAGLLASMLRQADKRLEDTRGELLSLQALHENIIRSTSSGLITTGLDGRITLVNASAEKLVERPEKQLLGEAIAPLFQDRLPQAASGYGHGEVRFAAPNGFRKTFRVLASELTVPGRGAVGHVYTLDDLTQLRRLEREVRMQDRLAAVGRLSAAIAHEVRNPLTSIAGSASLLSEMPDLNEEHRHLLQIVTRESERLNDIITDFLAYSRTKQYRFAEVDLIPLLEDTLTLSIEEAGSDWQFSFADTGPGMSPQMVEKVFEPFQSQFEGGTGLGLAIVYQIVQAHEGKVWVRSKPGQGCTFVLRVRKAAQEAAALPPGKEAGAQVSSAASPRLIGEGAHA